MCVKSACFFYRPTKLFQKEQNSTQEMQQNRRSRRIFNRASCSHTHDYTQLISFDWNFNYTFALSLLQSYAKSNQINILLIKRRFVLFDQIAVIICNCAPISKNITLFCFHRSLLLLAEFVWFSWSVQFARTH